MYDLRQTKTIDLSDAICLKEETTYKFTEQIIGKQLIAKFISYYDDLEDIYLITEFKKLAMLSGEPEIATVYYLAKANLKEGKSCYVMEFVKGQTLNEFLENRKSIIYEVIFDLILQLASGMEKAHNYEIYHSDLHNENILINEFGYLKIIDFLWWDYNLTKEVNQEKDLSDFKRITEEFENKCKESDKKRFKLISQYCKSITSFKGLKKELQLLDEVSFELAMMDLESQKLLSKLFELTENIYELKMYFSESDYIIPDKLISPLQEREKEFLEKIKNKGTIQYLDSRIERVSTDMKNIFNAKFHILKQIDLLDWNLNISNSDVVFEGPYKLHYQVWFTSKFFKWKKTHELFPLVVPTPETFEELLDI